MRRIILFAVALALFAAPLSVSARPQRLGNYQLAGDTQDPVEQLSPDWRYPSNGYNQWQCTRDGTLEEY
jgi:hypothetical protein